MKTKVVLTAGVLLFVLGAATAYYLYNKPHRDIAAEKAAFTLTAEELYRDYEADESGANAKYLDKVIIVTGTVENISQDQQGYPVVTLASGNLGTGVTCTMSKDADDFPDSPGATVTLKGRCTGKLMDVVMVDCSIQPQRNN